MGKHTSMVLPVVHDIGSSTTFCSLLLV